MNEWQETGAIAERVTITFAGINQDEKDKLDMQNFARGLKAPTKEDPGGKAFRSATWRRRDPGNLAMSPMDGVRLGLAVVLCLLGWSVLPSLGLADGPLVVGCGALGLLGAALPSIFAAVRSKQAEAVTGTVNDAFTLTISPADFAVFGQVMPKQSFELSAIDRFDGQGRLSLHRRDAAPVTLPCSLPSRAHAGLAARLNELLEEARRLRGGYRDG